jgi:hypothetical protein
MDDEDLAMLKPIDRRLTFIRGGVTCDYCLLSVQLRTGISALLGILGLFPFTRRELDVIDFVDMAKGRHACRECVDALAGKSN